MLNTIKGIINVGKHILNEETSVEKHAIDPNIGAEILFHYQQKWSELHEANEENASKATKVADEINRLHAKITNDHSSLSQIYYYLSEAGPLLPHINNCLMQVNKLYNDFDTIEKSLFTLEDLIEKIELEEKKIEHKHELALFKEKKLLNLEVVRTSLASKHAQNVVDHELNQKKFLQNKQQVYQDAFKRDLVAYKTLGELPRKETPAGEPSALLEDIQLELDKEELNKFLDN